MINEYDDDNDDGDHHDDSDDDAGASLSPGLIVMNTHPDSMLPLYTSKMGMRKS